MVEVATSLNGKITSTGSKNVLTAQVQIEGVRPIFWHHFGPDALPLQKGEREGVAGNDPSEWKRTVLKTSTGQLYVDGSYVFGSMKEAAKYTKKGRATLQSPLVATLQIGEDRILIDRFMPEGDPPTDPDSPVYLDIRGVRNPTTKARNVRYRIAASSGWHATFSLIWDKTIVSRGEMQAVLIDAGKLVGLGNGRSIGMGRFSVLEFEIED